MGEPAQAIPWTYEDYLLFPEDGKRYEIVEGDCYMSPSPSTRHQKISFRLGYLLQDYLQSTKAGEAFDAPMDVVLSATNIVQPDLLVILAARTSIITDANIQGAPDLVYRYIHRLTHYANSKSKRFQ